MPIFFKISLKSEMNNYTS